MARPVTARPAGANGAPAGSPRRAARSVAPRAGRRHRAAALVLSPLARQIAALGLALCAVALSVAYPLRNYLEQQVAEQTALVEQHQLERQVADLQAQQAALKDPTYIRAEAKRRLQYVTPGDTVYVVKVPATATASPPAPAAASPTGGAGAPAGVPGAAGAGSGVTPGSSGDGAAGSSESGTAAGTVGGTVGASTAGAPVEGQPWYSAMWDTLDGDGGGAVAPTR